MILEKKISEEQLLEFAIENSTVDFEVTKDEYIIYCEVNNLHILNEKIINRFSMMTTIQLTWKSEVSVNVKSDKTEKLFKLLNILEDNEDVQNVSSNFEISEEMINELTA